MAIEFHEGQHVMVVNAHVCGIDMEGQIVHKRSNKDYPRCILVKIEDMDLWIEPERIIDYEQYWK